MDKIGVLIGTIMAKQEYAKVPELKENLTFRAKALRRELVVGGRGKFHQNKV